MSSADIALMRSSSPSTSRPSGCSGNTASENSSCTRSPGSSSRMRISSRMTWRSASTSSARNAGSQRMSERMSRPMSRLSSSTRRWNAVYSLVVKAFMSPPTASTASAMARADHRGVPLNRRCSRKCDAPAASGASSREPVPTQKPTVTERTSGMRSVTTVRPLSSVVVRIKRSALPAPAAGAAVVAPGPAAALAPPAAGARRLAGAEVAELLGRLLLPGVLERHHLAAPGLGCRRTAVAAGGCFGTSAVAGGSSVVATLPDRRQRDLALLVDVVHSHVDLVAEVEHVLHPLDPLAPAQLGDVDQAVAAREDVHEGAELGDVDDLARVDDAD